MECRCHSPCAIYAVLKKWIFNTRELIIPSCLFVNPSINWMASSLFLVRIFHIWFGDEFFCYFCLVSYYAYLFSCLLNIDIFFSQFFGEAIERIWPIFDPRTRPQQAETPHPLSFLSNVCPAHHYHSQSQFKDAALRVRCFWPHLDWIHDWTWLRTLYKLFFVCGKEPFIYLFIYFCYFSNTIFFFSLLYKLFRFW